MKQFDVLMQEAQKKLDDTLVYDNYDSVSNWIRFYNIYLCSDEPLVEVFNKYSPPVYTTNKTCVGLALSLIERWRSLDQLFPGFAKATSIVSCEEDITDVKGYVGTGGAPEAAPHAVKEHVMACVQLIIDGRYGVMLADPGYHIRRLVFVMKDSQYPHTGWFKQSEEPGDRKDYMYRYNSKYDSYVEWRVQTTNYKGEKVQTSLIYTAQPFLDFADVTERRNLVYGFKTIVARDAAGNQLAGMYFKVQRTRKSASFTTFVVQNGKKKKLTYSFNAFVDPETVQPSVLAELEQCSLAMRYKKCRLFHIITDVAAIFADHSFIDQMIDINEAVNRMSNIPLPNRRISPSTSKQSRRD